MKKYFYKLEVSLSKLTSFATIILFLIIFINNKSFGQSKTGDCKNGFGTYIFEDGSKYVGNWKNSKPNGKGTFFDSEKTYIYKGIFIDGVEHGMGKYMFFDFDTVVVYYTYAGDMIVVKGNWDYKHPQLSKEEVTEIIKNDKPGIYNNTKSEMLDFTSNKKIKLLSEGGVFKTEVNINGIIKLHFIIDSGASEVNIPEDVVRTLIRAKAIKLEDFLPGKTYVLADGSNVKSARFYVRSLSIGSITIYNIEASIGSKDSDLLLGQSFLKKFSNWTIDNKSNTLTLVK